MKVSTSSAFATSLRVKNSTNGPTKEAARVRGGMESVGSGATSVTSRQAAITAAMTK